MTKISNNGDVFLRFSYVFQRVAGSPATLSWWHTISRHEASLEIEVEDLSTFAFDNLLTRSAPQRSARMIPRRFFSKGSGEISDFLEIQRLKYIVNYSDLKHLDIIHQLLIDVDSWYLHNSSAVVNHQDGNSTQWEHLSTIACRLRNSRGVGHRDCAARLYPAVSV